MCVTNRISPKGDVYQFLYVCTASQIYYVSDEEKTIPSRLNKFPSRTNKSLCALGKREMELYQRNKIIDLEKSDNRIVLDSKLGYTGVDERTKLAYLLSSR